MHNGYFSNGPFDFDFFFDGTNLRGFTFKNFELLLKERYKFH